MPWDLSNPNLLDPWETGASTAWQGVRQAAGFQPGGEYHLPGLLPYSALAGAGLGLAFGPRKRKLRSALYGGAAGLLAGLGGAAALGGASGYNMSNSVLDEFAGNGIGTVAGRMSERWNSRPYLDDLYNTKAPASAGWPSGSNPRMSAFRQIADGTKSWHPMDLLGMNTPAQGLADQARLDYTRQAFRDRLPIHADEYQALHRPDLYAAADQYQALKQPVPQELQQAIQAQQEGYGKWITEQTEQKAPDLLKDWPSTNIGAKLNQNFFH